MDVQYILTVLLDIKSMFLCCVITDNVQVTQSRQSSNIYRDAALFDNGQLPSGL